MKSLTIYKLTKKLKHLFIFTFLLLVIFTVTSCKKNETIENPMAIVYKNNIPYILNVDGKTLSLEEYDEVLNSFDQYLGVKQDDKWGFIKNNGAVATKIKYDRIGRMAEDKAVVVEDGDTFIINPSGDVLYTFANNITSYSYFSNNKLIIEKDGLLGYLQYTPETSSFSISVEPTYQYADVYSEGFAVVGSLVEDKVMYNYINEQGTLLSETFIFNEAYPFHDGLGRVGNQTNTGLKYSYIKNTLNEQNEIQYLTDSKGSQISYDYAADFSNGIAFVANYNYYSNDSEDLNYYRWYSLVDVSGLYSYEYELQDIMKKIPKNFYPQSPIFIDNTLVFINGYRSSNVWNLYRFSEFKQINENDEYINLTRFNKIDFNIDENNDIIKQLLTANDWTIALAKSLLSSPYELKNLKYNSQLGCYIASAKISGDKVGMIKINVTPNTEDSGNSIDENLFQIEYFIVPIYDNIIY